MEAMTLEEFKGTYNNYIKNWLAEELTKKGTELEGAAKEKKEPLEKEIEKIKFRQSLGDYLNVSSPEEVPQDLVWEDGLDQPEFADPEAKKGGVFQQFMGSFPSTLRWFGSNSNGGFRGYLFDDVNIRLVDIHPITGNIMPGLAKRWAESVDGKTVFFDLHTDIKYTDGTALKGEDFHRSIFVMASDYVNSPYFKQFFREEFAQITLYSDTLISVTLPDKKPLMPWKIADDLFPAPEEFYSEYGPDFEERYQWRPVPHTGAYYVADDGFTKGVSLKQTRVKDWWGDDKPFYQYRYNPEVINFTVIRDESKAFELFKIGKLDLYQITIPERFYEKIEIDPVFDGYIEKAVFYHEYPQIPRGIFFNVSNTMLKDKNLRLGVHYAMNWEKVINVVHRGDYSRLQQFYQGYGDFVNPKIKARTYSIEKARAYFAKAGYTIENEEGYLENKDGKELSLALNYAEIPYYTKMLKILKTEAKKAGLNLYLDAKEGSTAFKTLLEKKHELAFSGWGVSPPFPYYYQFFHSDNAYDAEGNPKPFTNNINCFSNPRMDELAQAFRSASSIEELEEISMEAQQIIHDEAIFIPSYAVDFYRFAYWRWLKWPDTDEVQFNAPLKATPTDLHVHWIDEKVKAETLEAKRAGRTFPEVVHIYDQYREKGGKQ